MQRTPLSWRWLVLMGGLLLPVVMTPAVARAAGISITHAETALVDSVYWLDATIAYDLSEPVIEALDKGVPLTFLLEIDVTRMRDMLWDEDLATLQQRYQLQYHALTDQYLVRNLNSGAQHALPTLGIALSVMGTVIDLPILDRKLLQPGERYLVNLRAALDIESLPVPMRVIAYFSSDWRLASAWYTWPLPF